ncbi:HAD family phosphatase [Anaerobacillus alkaliphilus]|uniref:HAD family phosphatase n=1 Tax=Anaerobacillus alkaliphilus TaxID=1548597 RepID=A0A4Q0VSY3_9BACI|nr:Cof-type HAD-IIB family hydrolase [Anaerobacillus alkaliphilus]RXI99874.1 HAD family phosphatase [Anaerobacillus alkaliphilus]
MAYRLLALDIDGTLLQSNHRLAKQTKEAIEYAKRKGVYVTLATGRSFPSAQKVANALNLETDIITHDGAFIGSSLESPTFERRLNNDKAFHIVELLEKHNCHIRVMHEKFAIGNKIRQKNFLVAKMTVGIGDPVFYPVTFVDSLSNYLLSDPVMPPKIHAFFFHEKDRLAAKEDLIKQIPGIHVTSSSEGGLEIVSEGISKATGLQILGKKLGISLNKMVAIGAYDNDIEMITQVGLGVAMGNAPKYIRDQADWVTRSNNQNGVAYMVKEVFRKQLNMQL